MKVLFIGDIFGKAGRSIIIDRLPELKEELSIEFCVANGENVAQGRGITEKTAKPLFEAGIDVFTSGNHLWDKKGALEFIKSEPRILKPINIAESAYGNDYYLHQFSDGRKIAVFTVIGQAFMGPADSPFRACEKMLAKLRKETSTILVDFHAEATAEKRALGFFLAGKVSALLGTHTHIQTADEEILKPGTAYLTDAGMTGPHDSVIGVKKEIILEKMMSDMPKRYEPAEGGLELNGVYLEIDDESGRAVDIRRIKRKYNE